MDINIVYGANDKFTRYTYISLLSLLKNTKNNVNCYLLTMMGNPWVKEIKKLEKLFKNFKFNEVLCEINTIKGLKTSNMLNHLNINTYLRFFVSELGVNRVIYLDSDIVVIWDICGLYKENLENKIVWVVSEWPSQILKDIKNIISFKWKKYFNAWVMLIDLNLWKRFWISWKCLNLLKERTYPANDQDVLNIILEKDSKYFDGKYNVQSFYFSLNNNFVDNGFDIDYYKDAVKNPIVIHYTWQGKPRHLLNNHPRRRDYDKAVWYAILISIKIGNFMFINNRETLTCFLHTIEQLFLPNYFFRTRFRAKVRKRLIKLLPTTINKK